MPRTPIPPRDRRRQTDSFSPASPNGQYKDIGIAKQGSSTTTTSAMTTKRNTLSPPAETTTTIPRRGLLSLQPPPFPSVPPRSFYSAPAPPSEGEEESDGEFVADFKREKEEEAKRREAKAKRQKLKQKGKGKEEGFANEKEEEITRKRRTKVDDQRVESVDEEQPEKKMRSRKRSLSLEENQNSDERVQGLDPLNAAGTSAMVGIKKPRASSFAETEESIAAIVGDSNAASSPSAQLRHGQSRSGFGKEEGGVKQEPFVISEVPTVESNLGHSENVHRSRNRSGSAAHTERNESESDDRTHDEDQELSDGDVFQSRFPSNPVIHSQRLHSTESQNAASSSAAVSATEVPGSQDVLPNDNQHVSGSGAEGEASAMGSDDWGEGLHMDVDTHKVGEGFKGKGKERRVAVVDANGKTKRVGTSSKTGRKRKERGGVKLRADRAAENPEIDILAAHFGYRQKGKEGSEGMSGGRIQGAGPTSAGDSHGKEPELDNIKAEEDVNMNTGSADESVTEDEEIVVVSATSRSSRDVDQDTKANVNKLISAINDECSAYNMGDGISEDEDEYRSTPQVARPKELKKFQAWAANNLKKNAEQAAQLAERAKELGMRPDFVCEPEKQRKKPYQLDSNDPGMVIPKSINRFLRRYQRQGVQFLYDRYKGIKYEGVPTIRGGVLGDDMGLGKTIQVIAFLSAIMGKTGTTVDLQSHRFRPQRVRKRWREGQETSPEMFGPTCFIVCPTSLRLNWEREIQTWGYFEVGVYDGTATERSDVIKKYKQGFYDIVIATISKASMMKDAQMLEDLKFSVLIVDEAHTLKNPSADRTSAMKNLQARARFALTGTLMQNRYKEMWSVLDFVAPGLVGSEYQWRSQIDEIINKGNSFKAKQAELAYATTRAQELGEKILAKFFLRRTKAEVALELPEKNDQVVFCPLTAIQEKIYRRVTKHPDLQRWLRRTEVCPLHTPMLKSECCDRPPPHIPEEKWNDYYAGVVFKFLAIFRKLSSHVGLVYPLAGDTVEQKEKMRDVFDICFPPPDLDRNDDGEYDSDSAPDEIDFEYRKLSPFNASVNPNFSGKWIVLMDLMFAWKNDRAAKNKVLIFSSSVRLLGMLELFLGQAGFTYQFLHGGVAADSRQEMVDRFQTDESQFCFLISELAGVNGKSIQLKGQPY